MRPLLGPHLRYLHRHLLLSHEAGKWPTSRLLVIAITIQQFRANQSNFEG